MDVAAPRRAAAASRSWKLSRKQAVSLIVAAGFLVGLIAAVYWYKHRNDQVVLRDQYQVVYLLSGQVYFGKLQNTDGQYLTLKNVYTLQSESATGDSADATSPTNILKVSRQVYGPEDSMAIRADQVQFWQNLHSDSKVAKAIESDGQGE